MKERNFISYIFTGFEILYLAKCMGAEKIIDMSFEEFKHRGNIMKEAEKSLISKNYVFRNFNGDLIFNKELVKYFKPVAEGRVYALCSINAEEYSKNSCFYIKGDDFVCIEKDAFNEENFVLTRGKGINNIKKEFIGEADCFFGGEEFDGTIDIVFGSLSEENRKPGFLSYGFSKGKGFKINPGKEPCFTDREEMEKEIDFEIKKLTADERA